MLGKSRKYSTFGESDKNKTVKRYKVSDVLQMLKHDGWYLYSHSGTSHRQFKHPVKKGKVTINGKPSQVLNQFLLNSIFKQAGWK